MRTAILLLITAAMLSGKIVDRIAASIGYEVITDTQVERELRVTAFFEGTEPDYTPTNKRKVLDRMIDQALVRREIEFTRFQQPPVSETKPLLAQLLSQYGGEAGFQRALEKYDITQEDVLERLRWQLMMLQFIEYRFQPSVQVTNSEVRQEYRRQSAAWRQKNTNEPPPLEDIRSELEKIVRQRLTDSALDRWLGEVRTQNTILYREGYQ